MVAPFRMTEVVPAGCQAWFSRVVTGNCSVGRAAFASTLDVFILRLRDASVERVIPAHRKTITGVAWHPVHGRWLATGGLDGRIAVWDVMTGHLAAVLNLEDTSPALLAWQPTGDSYNLAFTTKNGNVQLWSVPLPTDVDDSAMSGTLNAASSTVEETSAEAGGGGESVRSLETNEDGKEATVLSWEHNGESYLVIGRADGSVSILDVLRDETKDFRRGLDDGEDEEESGGGKVGVGSEKLDVEEETGAVTAVECSPHGQYVVASYRNGAMSMFDSLSGREVMEFGRQPQAVLRCAWLPWAPGTFLTVDGRSGSIRVWNVSQARPIGMLDVAGDDGVVGLAVLDLRGDGGGESSIGGGDEQTASMAWPFHVDAQNVGQRAGLDVLSSGLRHARMAIVSVVDGSVLLLDLSTGRVRARTAPGHVETIFSLRWHPRDPNTYATSSYDGSSKIWNGRTGRCALTLSDPGEGIVYRSAWSPRGGHLATVTNRGSLVIWNVRTGLPDVQLKALHSGAVVDVAWGGDGREGQGEDRERSGLVATASADGSVAVVNGENGDELFMLDHPLPVNGVAWAPGAARTLATACADRGIRIYDVPSGAALESSEKPMPRLIHELRGHEESVYTLRFSPLVPSLLASAADDGSIRVWDLARRGEGREMQGGGSGHRDRARCLCWSHEFPWLLFSGGWDSMLCAWDVRSKSLLGSAIAHKGCIYAVDSHPLRPFVLATAGRDTSIRMWELAPGPVARLRGRMIAAAVRYGVSANRSTGASRLKRELGRLRDELEREMAPTAIASLRSGAQSPRMCGVASQRVLRALSQAAAAEDKEDEEGRKGLPKSAVRVQGVALVATLFCSGPHLDDMWELAASTAIESVLERSSKRPSSRDVDTAIALGRSPYESGSDSILAPLQLPLSAPKGRSNASTFVTSGEEEEGGDEEYEGGGDGPMGVAGEMAACLGAAAGPGVRAGGASGCPPWAGAAESSVLAGGAYSRGGRAAPLAWGGGRPPLASLRALPHLCRQRATALLAAAAAPGAAGVGRPRPTSTRLAAASLALAGGDVSLYCEALAAAGSWDAAIAAAPAAGPAAWRALCQRRAQEAIGDGDLDDVTLGAEDAVKGIAPTALAQSLPLLIATGEWQTAAGILVDRGEYEGALYIAASATETIESSSSSSSSSSTTTSTKKWNTRPLAKGMQLPPAPLPRLPSSSPSSVANAIHSLAPSIQPAFIASQVTQRLAEEALLRGESESAAATLLVTGNRSAAVDALRVGGLSEVGACLASVLLSGDSPQLQRALWRLAHRLEQLQAWDDVMLLLQDTLHASPETLGLVASRYIPTQPTKTPASIPPPHSTATSKKPPPHKKEPPHHKKEPPHPKKEPPHKTESPAASIAEEAKDENEEDFGWTAVLGAAMEEEGEEDEHGEVEAPAEEEKQDESTSLEELQKRWKLPKKNRMVRKAAELKQTGDFVGALACLVRARRWTDAAVVGSRMIRHALGQKRSTALGWDLAEARRITAVLGFVPLQLVTPVVVRDDAVACMALAGALELVYRVQGSQVMLVRALFRVARRLSRSSGLELPLTLAEMNMIEGRALLEADEVHAALTVVETVAEEWETSERNRERACIEAAERIQEQERFAKRQEARKKRGVRTREAPPPAPEPIPEVPDTPEIWAKQECHRLATLARAILTKDAPRPKPSHTNWSKSSYTVSGAGLPHQAVHKSVSLLTGAPPSDPAILFPKSTASDVALVLEAASALAIGDVLSTSPDGSGHPFLPSFFH